LHPNNLSCLKAKLISDHSCSLRTPVVYRIP